MADNWRDFPLPDGSYADPTRPWTQQDVVNYLPVRAEQQGTRSPVKFATAPGLGFYCRAGDGPIRGMRDVEGALFVVSGTGLYQIENGGTPTYLGEVPGTGLVVMTHNQVAGGNQLVIANGSSGYIYDTRHESLLTPAEPVDVPGENPTAPGGGAPSTGLGPNGGYPDDAEPSIPEPTVFGTDVVPNGDFTDPTDLDDWKDRLGNDLTGWSIVAGKAHYNGIGTSMAVLPTVEYRMSPHPMPRYSVTLTADVNCDAGAKVAIGMNVSYRTGENENGAQTFMSTPTEYLVATPITYTFEYEAQDAGFTALGQFVYPTAKPLMRVEDESGVAVEADFDNFTMAITEVAMPVTTQTLTNLDFASGLTGWTSWPSAAGVPALAVSGGEVTMTTTGTADFLYLVNDDPIDLADALDKWVHIEAEVWSNDPTTVQGVPQNGVALGLCLKGSGGYVFPPRTLLYERGDWTAREVWLRQWMPTASLADYTVHLCVAMRAKAGYKAKVRGIACEVSNSAVP